MVSVTQKIFITNSLLVITLLIVVAPKRAVGFYRGLILVFFFTTAQGSLSPAFWKSVALESEGLDYTACNFPSSLFDKVVFFQYMDGSATANVPQLF